MPQDLFAEYLVKKSARKHGVDERTVLAMAKQESGVNPGAVSKAGARGTLQVMPDTGHRFVSEDEFNTVEGQIEAGVRYYKHLRDRYGNDEQAIAGYHAGEGAVDKAIKAGKKLPSTYDRYAGISTQDHVKAVMGNVGASEEPDLFQQFLAKKAQAAPASLPSARPVQLAKPGAVPGLEPTSPQVSVQSSQAMTGGGVASGLGQRGSGIRLTPVSPAKQSARIATHRAAPDEEQAVEFDPTDAVTGATAVERPFATQVNRSFVRKPSVPPPTLTPEQENETRRFIRSHPTTVTTTSTTKAPSSLSLLAGPKAGVGALISRVGSYVGALGNVTDSDALKQIAYGDPTAPQVDIEGDLAAKYQGMVRTGRDIEERAGSGAFQALFSEAGNLAPAVALQNPLAIGGEQYVAASGAGASPYEAAKQGVVAGGGVALGGAIANRLTGGGALPGFARDAAQEVGASALAKRSLAYGLGPMAAGAMVEGKLPKVEDLPHAVLMSVAFGSLGEKHAREANAEIVRRGGKPVEPKPGILRQYHDSRVKAARERAEARKISVEGLANDTGTIRGAREREPEPAKTSILPDASRTRTVERQRDETGVPTSGLRDVPVRLQDSPQPQRATRVLPATERDASAPELAPPAINPEIAPPPFSGIAPIETGAPTVVPRGDLASYRPGMAQGVGEAIPPRVVPPEIANDLARLKAPKVEVPPEVSDVGAVTPRSTATGTAVDPAAPTTKPTEPVKPVPRVGAQAKAEGGAVKTPKAEKVSDSTGLTKTQSEYLATELKTAMPELPEKTEAGKAVTIKVPGDGEFTVNTQVGANRLHKTVTGKPIDAAMESKSLATGVRRGGITKEPAGYAEAIELYGKGLSEVEGRAKTLEVLKKQRDVEMSDPEHDKAMMGRLDSVIAQLEEKARIDEIAAKSPHQMTEEEYVSWRSASEGPQRGYHKQPSYSERSAGYVRDWLRSKLNNRIDADGVLAEKYPINTSGDVRDALVDWQSKRAYIDGNGNYHIKTEGKPSGPIAPWNKAAKAKFKTPTDLHDAAAEIFAEKPQTNEAKYEAAKSKQERTAQPEAKPRVKKADMVRDDMERAAKDASSEKLESLIKNIKSGDVKYPDGHDKLRVEVAKKELESRKAPAPPAPTEAPKGYGSRNKITTKADKDAAMDVLRDKTKRGSGGPDAEERAALGRLALYHAEAIGREFADYAKWLKDELGERYAAFEPHLKAVWDDVIKGRDERANRGTTEAVPTAETVAVTAKSEAVSPRSVEADRGTDREGLPRSVPASETAASPVEPHHSQLQPRTERGEFDGPPQRETGIKNETVEGERAAQALAPVEKTARRSFGEVWEGAKSDVDGGKADPRALARELSEKPRPLTDREDAILTYERMRLQNAHKETMTAIEAAQKAKDSNAESSARTRLEDIERDIDTNDIAATRAGSENARGLNARRMMVKEDYSLARLVQRAKVEGDGKVPEATRARLEDISKKLEAAEAELAVKTDRITELESKREINRQIRDTRRTRRAESKDKIDVEYAALKTEFNAWARKSQVNALFDAEAAKIVAKLARNRVRAGINTVEGVVDSLYNDLKDSLDGLTKRDVRDALSGYGKTAEMSKDQISSQLRELRQQARIISSIEDAQSGQRPARSGLQRPPQSAKIAELRRQLAASMKRSGLKAERPVPTDAEALAKLKESTEKSIASFEEQIATGRFKEPTPRRRVPPDEATQELIKQRDTLKKQADAEVRKLKLARMFGVSPEGMTGKPGKDFHLRHRATSPNSLLDFTGSYERVAGPLGKATSELIRQMEYDVDHGKMTFGDGVRHLRSDLRLIQSQLRAEGKPGMAEDGILNRGQSR